MSGSSGFFEELKRRRVFRVAVVYTVAMAAIFGVADFVWEPLLLPNWTPTLIIVLGVLAFPIAIVLGWAYDLTLGGVVRTSSVNEAERHATAATRSAVPGDGIVVLPFESLSPNEDDEYFSDGVTEDLIGELWRIGSLRVISRTSAWQYKAARVGAKQIANELGVAYLLEGSVRRSGTRVRITAQLIDARPDGHVWADTYDRELGDIFTIQSEVADKIASALKPTFTDGSAGPATPAAAAVLPLAEANDGATSGAPDVAPTSDLEAYDLYLRGRHLWNRRSPKDLIEGVSYLRAAIERDPGFVRARSALAEAYVTIAIYGSLAPDEVLPLARKEAGEALARDPTEAPALTALACVRAIYEWEWAHAELGFGSAMKANPQYPTAPQWLAMNVLVPQGRFDEAVSQLERARELDPMCPSVRASFGVIEFMKGDYGQAQERFRHLVLQDPGFQFGHLLGGLSALHGGNPAGAVESLEKALAVGGWSPEVASALGCAFVADGREAEGRESLRRLLNDDADRYVSPVRISQLQVALSEYDTALSGLEGAVTGRATDLIWVDVHPGFAPIRGDPRYAGVRRAVFGQKP